MKTLGKNIRYYRKEKGYTQEQLAEITGISKMSIRRYETGERQPKIETVQKIADGLGVDIFRLSATPLDEFHKEVVKEATEEENKLLNNYRRLNHNGRTEARKRVQELTEIKRYTEMEEPDTPD